MPGIKSRKKKDLLSSPDVSRHKRKRLDDDIFDDIDNEDEIEDSSMFGQVVKEAGMTLKAGTDPHVLDCDKAVFLRKVKRDLQTHAHFPDNVTEFIDGLVKHLEQDDLLVKALGPTLTASSCTSARSVSQDSLVRLMLSIEDIQPKLLTWLLEKMATIALTEDPQRNTQAVNKPQLILSQIRWLDRIINGAELADKLHEILQASPQSVQQDIIISLPEIIDDAQHPKIAMHLRDMLRQDRELTNAILDAFTNLSLKQDILSELQSSVMKTVASVPMESLPTVLKFIIQTIEPGTETSCVTYLREELDLTPSGSLSTQKKSQVTKPETKDAEVLCYDTLRLALTCNRKIADAWFRAIDGVKTTRDHKTLDILVLLILHSLPNRRRPVEAMIKNKIRAGLFTEELFKKTFRGHWLLLKQCFEDIIGLIEVLLQSAEASLNYSSLVLCRQAFLNFDKFPYCQQEIIANLVNKVGSGGHDGTRETALVILSYMVHKHTDKMLQYALFVASVLDYIDTMDLSDVRRIMDILSLLAYARSDDVHCVRDDLHIVLRKQLSSSNLKIKRMGVIGAVMTVKNMSVRDDVVHSSHPSQDTSRGSDLPTSVLKQARHLLDMVKSSTKNTGDMAGLFMDELANVIAGRKIDKALEKWIADTMTNDFQDEFILDAKPTDEKLDGFLPLTCYGNLETCDDGDPQGIAIDLGTMVIKNMELSQLVKSTGAVRFIPHFRLLKMCAAVQNGGNLEDIDALLGCPLFVPKDVDMKFESLSINEKNVCCATSFYLINWFRELINAFASQEDADYRRKVLIRLKQTLLCQTTLVKRLQYNLNFIPPVVQHHVDASSWQPPGASARNKKGKGNKSGEKGKKGRKRKGNDTEMINLSTQHSSVTQANATAAHLTQIEEVEAKKGLVDIEHYAPFFRELDMDALNILSYNTITIESEPELEEELEDPKFRPPELNFLLQDLIGKLDHILVASVSKKKSFPGKSNPLKNAGFSNLDRQVPVDVATKTVGLLDYILGNLENISDYFKRLININDGMLDAPGMFNEHTPILTACFTKCFRVIRSLLLWNGFRSSENRPLLKEALSMIGRRQYPKISENNSIAELVHSAEEYLEQFSETIIDVGCADEHLKLMDAIQINDPQTDTERKISAIAVNYLKREWNNVEGVKDKGAGFNGHVESLLDLHLKMSDDRIGALGDYVTIGMKEFLDAKGREAASATYPTFTKQTFPIHFRVLLSHLVAEVKGVTYGVTKDQSEQIDFWDRAVNLLHHLIMILKVHSTRALVGPTLKFSRLFLDHFLKHAMPVTDKRFRRNRDDCIGLLKNMQQCTRFLQHVCSHSKINQDVSLSNHVPLLKKALETFLFRVKAMLALNNCLDAFWMGNLKNRDLSGEEIMTQNLSVEGDETGEEEEEALPEEDQSDAEIEDEESNEDEENKSLSIEI